MAFFVRKQKSCCGCFSLKSGTLIISWIFLVTSVFIVYADLENFVEFCELVRAETPPTLIAYVQWASWTTFASTLLFHLIPYICAMYGAYMRKATYLQPFILLNAASVVNLISSLVLIVVTFIVLCVNAPGLESDITKLLENNSTRSTLGLDSVEPREASEMFVTAIYTILIIFFAIISVVTVIYYHFTCVVHSFYLKLKEEKGDYKYNMFLSSSANQEKKVPLA